MSKGKKAKSIDWDNAKYGDDMPDFIKETFKVRGRPPGSNKVAVSLRLDKDVVAAYKAGGPGWQSRMNETLRKGAKART